MVRILFQKVFPSEEGVLRWIWRDHFTVLVHMNVQHSVHYSDYTVELERF